MSDSGFNDIEDIKRTIISLLYKECLGRPYDDAGMKYYLDSDLTPEAIFYILYNSDEAKRYRGKLEEEERRREEDPTLPLTLATFVKNNEKSIGSCISSLKPIVREIVVVDTGSDDSTVDICKSLGARVYEIAFDGFDGFGNARTTTAHLAREPFVFMLDSDETILPEDLSKFKPIMERMCREDIDIVGLPRKRWSDLEMTEQLEKDVYPDLQYRLFKNKSKIKYVRRVHETITGSDKRIEVLDGPCIQHFQDCFKSGENLANRNRQYIELQKKDIVEGVKHTEKAVEDIDII